MYTVNFKRQDSTYQMEVSQEEFQEILEYKADINEKKRELSLFLDNLEKICPERVKRIVTELDLIKEI